MSPALAVADRGDVQLQLPGRLRGERSVLAGEPGRLALSVEQAIDDELRGEV
jgi:hypothetical protein